MRTTLDIDDHVLAVAREMSSVLEISLGAALSELARRGISQCQKVASYATKS
jgi:hypothetical protein